MRQLPTMKRDKLSELQAYSLRDDFSLYSCLATSVSLKIMASMIMVVNFTIFSERKQTLIMKLICLLLKGDSKVFELCLDWRYYAQTIIPYMCCGGVCMLYCMYVCVSEYMCVHECCGVWVHCGVQA